MPLHRGPHHPSYATVAHSFLVFLATSKLVAVLQYSHANQFATRELNFT